MKGFFKLLPMYGQRAQALLFWYCGTQVSVQDSFNMQQVTDQLFPLSTSSFSPLCQIVTQVIPRLTLRKKNTSLSQSLLLYPMKMLCPALPPPQKNVSCTWNISTIQVPQSSSSPLRKQNFSKLTTRTYKPQAEQRITPFQTCMVLMTTNVRFYPAQLRRLRIAQRYLQRWLLIWLLQQQLLCYSYMAKTSRDSPRQSDCS